MAATTAHNENSPFADASAEAIIEQMPPPLMAAALEQPPPPTMTTPTTTTTTTIIITTPPPAFAIEAPSPHPVSTSKPDLGDTKQHHHPMDPTLIVTEPPPIYSPLPHATPVFVQQQQQQAASMPGPEVKRRGCLNDEGNC
ncbi:hypothetical protein HDU67_003570 [Dinochytrium kinnereticum]|nr:hypothetical protein HDU67_003570 [Dinochytrium kinnereticum]